MTLLIKQSKLSVFYIAFILKICPNFVSARYSPYRSNFEDLFLKFVCIFISQESPTEIAGVVRNTLIRKAKQPDYQAKRPRNFVGDGEKSASKSKVQPPQWDIVSEFSSGLERENKRPRDQ